MDDKRYSAAAWRAAARKKREALPAEEITLPSGATVLARRPALETWLVHGRVPDSLSQAILALAGAEDQRRPLTAEEMAEIGAFNRLIVVKTVIAPRVVDRATADDEIAFTDLPEEDIEFILAWARRAPEVAQLDSFRRGAEPGAAGDRGADVRPAAEPAAGDDGPGAGA